MPWKTCPNCHMICHTETARGMHEQFHCNLKGCNKVALVPYIFPEPGTIRPILVAAPVVQTPAVEVDSDDWWQA